MRISTTLLGCLFAAVSLAAAFVAAPLSTMEPGTVVYKDPFQLRLHRFQKLLPDPDRKSTEWSAFVDAMQAAGPGGVPAVFITADGQVMDGGWRWRAAKELEWERIKCDVQLEERAGVLVVDTLLQRKQMTRGAAIYLALRFQEEFVAAAEMQRLSNLKRGLKTRESQLKNPVSSNLTKGVDPSVTSLCARWGITRETYYRAVEVKELFAKRPALREKLEPQLLNGEKNLWNILSAVGGGDTDQASRGLGVLKHAFSGFGKQADVWKKLNDAQRAELKQQWIADTAEIPASMRKTMKEIL